MISVIIPMYNVQSYIGDCIKSLELQTYQNFEIVCVDDSSKDKTLTIVNELKGKVSCTINIVTQEHNGVSFARNTGIQYAKGEYICFVDADDMLLPTYLEDLYKAIRKVHSHMAFCFMQVINEKDTMKNIGEKTWANSTARKRKSEKNQYITSVTSISLLRDLLYHRISLGVWNFLFEKSFIAENKLLFPVHYEYGEDSNFIWQAIAVADCIAKVNRKLYMHRVRKGSAMSYFDSRRIHGLQLRLQLEQFMKQRSDFSKEYNQYGVAIYVWSSLWQAVNFSKTYSEFCERIYFLTPYIHIEELYHYPNLLVHISSWLFLHKPKIYYKVIKLYTKNK